MGCSHADAQKQSRCAGTDHTDLKIDEKCCSGACPCYWLVQMYTEAFSRKDLGLVSMCQKCHFSTSGGKSIACNTEQVHSCLNPDGLQTASKH